MNLMKEELMECVGESKIAGGYGGGKFEWQ